MTGRPSREERIVEILHRLQMAAPAVSFDDAYRLLTNVVNTVEDELTDIPFDPDHWQTDGRLYPPQFDSIRDVPDRSRIKRFRTRGHNVYIADNGAIEIQRVRGKQVVFQKSGADGRTVWELE